MVRREKGEYEKRTAKEGKENRSQEKMWKMIKKLRGDGELKSKRCRLWDENGMMVEEEEEPVRMIEGWENIYQGNGNRMEEVWSGKREEYQLRWERGKSQDRERRNRVENNAVSMLRMGSADGIKEWLEEVVIGEEEIKVQIGKMKNGKQSGPDGIKNEMY